MNVPANIQARITTDVIKYVGMAERHFKKTYLVPNVRYDVRGTVGGYAQGTALVRFNPILLMENLDDFIARTVPHEVAHCIDSANGDNGYSIFMRRGKRSLHGPTWQRIMMVFGVKDATRCHSYDTKNAQVKTKAKFEYKCGCCDKSYFVSSVLHNRMARGQQRYCRVGGQTRGQLTLVGGLGKVGYREAREISAKRAANAATKEVPVSTFNIKEPVKVFRPESSNADRAKHIYTMFGSFGRQECIQRMVAVGIKATTASTYYNTLRSKA